MKFFLSGCITFFFLVLETPLRGQANSVWTPSLTKDAIMAKAMAGDSYYEAILGIYLRSGETGMKIDFSAAQKWSEKAADAGEPLGLYNLGNLALMSGDFEKSNTFYQDAQLRLTRKASEGDPIAQFAMGEICFYVIPKNPPRAIVYFHQSAEGGYPQAQATLGALYLKGLPPIMPRDVKKGISLLVDGARRHSMTSRFNLGMAYYNGEGVQKNNGLAIRWLRLAAEQNFGEAQYSLASLLSEVDAAKNKHEVTRLLQRAAAQDHAGAAADLKDIASGKLSLGKTTLNNKPPVKGSPTQLRLAIEHRAAGQRFYNGENTKQNFEKAYESFKKAAELGDPASQRYLGLLLFHGKGCAKDRKRAGTWLRSSASNGDLEAKRILSTFSHLFDK